MPAPGKPFLKIIKSGALEIKLIVPSRWLVWLRRGQKFEFAVDETAKSYPAKVMRISTEVDPVSQTVEIFGRLAQGTDVLVGMSGIARFKQSRGQPDDRASE